MMTLTDSMIMQMLGEADAAERRAGADALAIDCTPQMVHDIELAVRCETIRSYLYQAGILVDADAAPSEKQIQTSDDIGLSIDMLDVDRLRQWAQNLLIYGPDITHWSSVPFVVSKLQTLATCIEKAIKDIGVLRLSSPEGTRGDMITETEYGPCHVCGGSGQTRSTGGAALYVSCIRCGGGGQIVTRTITRQFSPSSAPAATPAPFEIALSMLQEVIDKSEPQKPGGQQVGGIRYQMVPSTRKELQRIARYMRSASPRVSAATPAPFEHRLEVTASYVLGGWSKTTDNEQELLLAIEEGRRLSPVAEVSVRQYYTPEEREAFRKKERRYEEMLGVSAATPAPEDISLTEGELTKRAEGAVARLMRWCDCGGEGCNLCQIAKVVTALALRSVSAAERPAPTCATKAGRIVTADEVVSLVERHRGMGSFLGRLQNFGWNEAVTAIAEGVRIMAALKPDGLCSSCRHLSKLELTDEFHVCPVVNIRIASPNEFGCTFYVHEPAPPGQVAQE